MFDLVFLMCELCTMSLVVALGRNTDLRTKFPCTMFLEPASPRAPTNYWVPRTSSGDGPGADSISMQLGYPSSPLVVGSKMTTT